MDSKIILAILIVALIGIVAATYHNETSDVINTLTSVETEDTPSDNPADIDSAAAGTGSSNSQNNLKIDEDVVKPDTTAVSSSPANKQQSNVRSSSSSSNTNNNQASNNQASGSPNTNNQNDNQITQEKAMNIAMENLPSQFSNAQIDKTTRYDDYYIVSFKENGEIIGEYEISAKNGKVTGGAFKNEVPNPSESIQQNQNNSGN